MWIPCTYLHLLFGYYEKHWSPNHTLCRKKKKLRFGFLVRGNKLLWQMYQFFTLERRIADVQKSRNMIAAEAKVDFSDAAGFRRPIKFNCISCSRPVELPLRGPLRANLPAPRGVRTKRSKGPYLSYEMDQVRIVVSACSFVWLVVDWSGNFVRNPSLARSTKHI